MTFTWIATSVVKWIYAEPRQVFTYDSFLFKCKVTTDEWRLIRYQLVDEATGEVLDVSVLFFSPSEFEVRFPYTAGIAGAPLVIVAPPYYGKWRLRAQILDGITGAVITEYPFVVNIAPRSEWKYETLTTAVYSKDYSHFSVDEFISRFKSEYPPSRVERIDFYDDIKVVMFHIAVQTESPVSTWVIILVVSIVLSILVVWVGWEVVKMWTTVAGRRWICPYCNKEFPTWGDLKAHKMTAHPDEWERYGREEEISAEAFLKQQEMLNVVIIFALAIGGLAVGMYAIHVLSKALQV